MNLDHSQFLKLFLHAQPSIRAYLFAMLRNADAEEDVFQEVALVLWERFGDYKQELPFTHWALGIARNHAVRWRSNKGRRQVWLTLEVEAQLAQASEDLEDELATRRHALDVCVQRLGDRARELLKMRYEQEHSLQDMADNLRMSHNAVNKALVKIRKFLLDCTAQLERASSHPTGGVEL